jgi:hypothetical protein
MVYIYSSCSVTRCHEILCPECGLLLRCTLRVILVQTWSKSASLLWPGHSTEWDYHFLLTLSSIHSRRNCLKKLESRQMPQHLDVTHIPGAHAIVEYSWLFTIRPRLSTLSWRASSTNWISFSLLSKSRRQRVQPPTEAFDQNVPSLSEARNAAELTALETLSRA